MDMTQRAPFLQKKITTLLSNQFLSIKARAIIGLLIKGILWCYVLDVVDPLTQSTHLGIDLYIHALNLVRNRM